MMFLNSKLSICIKVHIYLHIKKHLFKSNNIFFLLLASPYGKTKRRKWNDAEKKAIFSNFGDVRNCEKLPSLKKCATAIRKSRALTTRTPQQVKTWIDNQRKHKKNKV